MLLQQRRINAHGFRFSLTEKGKEVARGFLYILQNDLHKEPFGFLEDVYVREEYRGKGNGEKIVRAAIREAKRQGCYKLVGNSRNSREQTHMFYKKMGFQDYGKEFRMEF
ncbi:GNAT family N-acetyltransferase [Candidatus Woesearchaeota archaeon]|nr:GNAT family N-acetyltransferase [Candidatus Woesearchaeota archaeon]